MRLLTVGLWVVSAGIGVYLFCLWLAGGGLRRQKTKVTTFPTALIVMHPVLGLTSLASWVTFALTGHRGYAWLALGLLSVAILLGFTMFTRWLGGGRHARGAEQGFPVVAVLLHGVAGVITFVLVLLAATTLS
ncbi:hypothetical protein [Sphaerisporangium sp. TRM90804]|uniref:hypothetical protein n=1 Tax=Sphaerisporangium sp. TRM90804 TaxID=3031113 RepID=UPI0024487C49|nr:hypothetical protein [Sphaerisporangium sp. TRM90804]MDH2424235.1 hypothetical protein [Sphaerisporangium sp. TRM90804]